jgi:hypothetical protein
MAAAHWGALQTPDMQQHMMCNKSQRPSLWYYTQYGMLHAAACWLVLGYVQP